MERAGDDGGRILISRESRETRGKKRGKNRAQY